MLRFLLDLFRIQEDELDPKRFALAPEHHVDYDEHTNAEIVDKCTASGLFTMYERCYPHEDSQSN